MIRSLLLLSASCLTLCCQPLESKTNIIEQPEEDIQLSTYKSFPTTILLKEKDLRLTTEKYTILSNIVNDSITLSEVDTPVTGTDGKYYLLPVKKGEQFHIQFPGATRVFVNAGTRFLVNFMPYKHNFIVQGKAWIKTENDTAMVNTDDFTICILPHSKVNIDNYLDEPNTIISVMEGDVVVSHHNEHLPILPHEELWFNKSKQKTQIKKITIDVTSWTVGTFRRYPVDLKYQMREIGRLYNKSIYLDPALKDGIFPRLNFYYRKSTIEQIVNGYNSEPVPAKFELVGDTLKVFAVKTNANKGSLKGANLESSKLIN